jgi:hypothetical protein
MMCQITDANNCEVESDPLDKVSSIVRIVDERRKDDDEKGTVIVVTSAIQCLISLKYNLGLQGVEALIIGSNEKYTKGSYAKFALKREGTVLLMNNSRGVGGLDGLQSNCGCVIFYSGMGDSDKDVFVGRIKRLGQHRPVLYVYELMHTHM